MIAFAVNLYYEREKSENGELSIIGEQFGVRKVIINGHEIFNFSHEFLFRGRLSRRSMFKCLGF